MSNERVKTITRLGMLAAVSVVLASLIHFPLFPAASFLVYDPADIPILLSAFLYRPAAGVAVTFIVSVIQGLTVSAEGRLIGIIMHFVATSAFCIVASLIYRKKKDIKSLVLGLVLGALAMTVLMCGMNLLLTPLYTGMSISAVAGMIVPIILPFNLLKAGINAVVTFLLFLPLRNALSKAEENSLQ